MGGHQSKNNSSCRVLPDPWRNLDFGKKMKDDVKKLQLSNSDVKALRILVHGPVGAGKSCFINSIDSIFQERMVCGAIAEAQASNSFTKLFKIHKIKDKKYGAFLPFAICDFMGLEKEDSSGVHPDDLIKALEGHLKDGYEFNPLSSCSEKDPYYNSTPSLGDKIHCLVSVIPADIISLTDNAVLDKMRHVREHASNMGIPQVVVLTKVDQACPEVNKNIKLIYRSKRIKEKMQECSNKLGVTMNYIFPVKNYHNEIELNDEVDVLLLSALTFILSFANDHVAEMVQ